MQDPTPTENVIAAIGHVGIIAFAAMLVITLLWLLHDARKDEREWQAHLTLQTSIDAWVHQYVVDPKSPALVAEETRIKGLLDKKLALS